MRGSSVRCAITLLCLLALVAQSGYAAKVTNVKKSDTSMRAILDAAARGKEGLPTSPEKKQNDNTGMDMSAKSSAPVSMACNENWFTESGSYYRGCQTKTISGRTCQAWADQSPHKHTFTKAKMSPWKYEESRLIKNYCRQPESAKGKPWCYTTDPNKRYESCDPLPDDKKGLQCELGKEMFTMRDNDGIIMKAQPCAKSDSSRTFKSFEENKTYPLCVTCKTDSRLFVLTRTAMGGPSGACVPWGGRGSKDKGSIHGKFLDPLLKMTARCKIGESAKSCQRRSRHSWRARTTVEKYIRRSWRAPARNEFEYFLKLSKQQYVRISMANIKCFNKEVSYRWLGMMNPDQGFITVSAKDLWKRSRDVHMNKYTWRVMLWAYRSCSRVIKDKNGRGGRICQTMKSNVLCLRADKYKRSNSLKDYKIADCATSEVFSLLVASA